MDDSSPILIIFGMFVLFIVVMIAVGLNANKRQELRAFARHWNGRLHDAGLFGGSHVELDFGGVIARIDYTHGEDESLTHLTVPLRLPLGRLKLRPQNWGDQIGKFMGLEDIEIGIPGFDDSFVIQGSSPREIIKVLSEPVRSAILSIKRMARDFNNHVHLEVGSGNLRISLGRSLSTEAELSEFVTKCRVLFDLLNPASSQGIEFVSSSAPAVGTMPENAVPEEAECQICGTPLKENVVHCMKCKTPHHLDCWQYFGSCSVYGCGQKRFVEFGKR
jgi:hypothetical protein